ncbi:hypothetical protein D3C85_1751400 [compost metagenome]
MEHAVMEMLTVGMTVEQTSMPFAQVFTGRHQKTAGATGWIADHILGRWGG